MKRFMIAALAATAVTTPAWGDNGDVEQLKEELKRLQMQLKSLEKRLEQAESSSDEASATAKAAADKADTASERATVAQNDAADAKPDIHVGGALRFQFQRRGSNANDRATGGEIDIDTFRINLDGEISNIIFSAEYRFYPTFGNSHFIHHGWLGYDFSDEWRGQLGIMQVPFGIQPYASNNFFFSSNYYLGLEDDYDMGVNFIYNSGSHNLQLAFFKNDEYAEIFDDNRFKRYSYDPLNVSDGTNKEAIEEANTGNIRYAYRAVHAENAASEFGVSLQGGQIYNSAINEDGGDHWAAAGHLHGNYGPWNLMLQLTKYAINPEASPGFDTEIIGTGAYSFEYTMPAEAWTYLANLAYTQNVSIGPISALKYYNDFTYVDKEDPRLEETIQNVTGMSIAAGAFFTYVDFVLAKNQPFTTPYISSGGFGGAQLTDLGSAAANKWDTRFNINVGYYF
ncbi:hypothetical protein [Spectribacter hydrogenoxidans]|uniref:Phosphate-selective porin O and P n=1 Tax=Spectribacter hydrogenoxidans TaxID=3075608 RepID=A0ABU3BW84_9GAMM|nr:hypothetical protein [Salinisphaera sp. W335]MDT0633532.1 hypothetical protein [Salinisphaera sp. W335]